MSDILPESVSSVVVGSVVVVVVEFGSVVEGFGSFVVDCLQVGHGVSSISVQFPCIPHSNVLLGSNFGLSVQKYSALAFRLYPP